MKFFKEKYNILFILLCMIIFTYGIFLINNIDFPSSTADELGYMYTGAKLNGWDWTGVMQYHPFYGIGMGIIWSPLFMIFGASYSLLYRSIVFFNVIFVLGSFLCSLYVAKELFPDWNRTVRLLTCFLLISYPCVFFYLQSALPEIILVFLFWLLLAALINVYKKAILLNYFFVAFILVVMLFFHLRTIGLLICTAFFILYFTITEKHKISYYLIFISFLILGVILWDIFKEFYYFGVESNQINTVNSSISVFEMIKSMLYHLPDLIEGIIGKLFYFFVSGNIVFFYGLFLIVKIILNKNKNLMYYISLFLFFTFMLHLILYSQQNMIEISRLDQVVYGRYMENLVSPILLIGFYEVYNRKTYIPSLFFFLLSFICFVPFVMHRMETSETLTFAIDSAVSLGLFFNYYLENYQIYVGLLKTTCVVVFLASLICTCAYLIKQKWQSYCLILIIIFCFWTGTFLTSSNSYNSNRKMLSCSMEKISSIIECENVDKIIFLKEEGEDIGNNIKYLQFALGEQSIEVIPIDSSLDSYKNCIFIFNSSSEWPVMTDRDYNILYSDRLILVKKS